MPSIVYYTDNRLPVEIYRLCRDKLALAAGAIPVYTVGLNAPAGFGQQVVLYGEHGVLMMHRQIYAGLLECKPGPVFLAEHDVIYHPTHFRFVPLRLDTFYYNVNVWHARYPDGHCVYYDAQQVSGLCADRDLLIDFYGRRTAQIERDGHNRHYEPGLRQSVGGQRVENWQSALPNIDVRHGVNLTASKWSPNDFRNRKYAEGWQEADDLPGWGRVADLFAGV